MAREGALCRVDAVGSGAPVGGPGAPLDRGARRGGARADPRAGADRGEPEPDRPLTDIKWSSILRLRAVENRFFSLCTLHCDVNRKRTHPFAFAPDGTELSARQAGSEVVRPLSECCEAGSIYVIDLDMAKVGEPLDWSKIPSASKPKCPRNGQPERPIRIAVRHGQPAVHGCSGQTPTDSDFRVETVHGPVYVGVVPSEQILDATACFRVLDHAKQMKCAPIIWNHWDQLPADSARLATLMLGRAIGVLRTDRAFGQGRDP